MASGLLLLLPCGEREEIAARSEKRRTAPSARLVARERDAVHDAAVAVIIVDRIVQRAAIVPQRDRADLPAKPAREFRPRHVAEQILEDRRAFFLAHILE